MNIRLICLSCAILFIIPLNCIAESISELIEKGDINQAITRIDSKDTSTSEKTEALFQGIMFGDSDIVERLLKGGATVSEATYENICKAHHFHLLKMFFAHQEPSPIARERLFNCATEQEAFEAYPILTDGGKISPEAIGKAYLSVIREGRPLNPFKSLKPSLSVVDEQGRTALHWAVIRQNQDLVNVLLKAGAKKAVKDNAGKTAGDYAKEMKFLVKGL